MESGKDGYHLDPWYKWHPNSEFLLFNTEGESYGFYTESDIKAWQEDFGMSEESINDILNLKPGEVWTEDYMNYTIRIKK